MIADALPRLELIRALTFEPVISGAQNDPAAYLPWTEPVDQKDLVGVLQRGTKDKKAPYVAFTESAAIASTAVYVED